VLKPPRVPKSKAIVECSCCSWRWTSSAEGRERERERVNENVNGRESGAGVVNEYLMPIYVVRRIGMWMVVLSGEASVGTREGPFEHRSASIISLVSSPLLPSGSTDYLDPNRPPFPSNKMFAGPACPSQTKKKYTCDLCGQIFMRA